MVAETMAMRGQDGSQSRLQRSILRLIDANVRYLVVGAYAVIHYTEPRFADAWARATQTTSDGMPIRILSLEDLLVAKRAAARPQDLLDVSRLEEARRRNE